MASGKYYPIIFLNDYWNLNSDYQPINATLSHLNLSLTFSHLQLWKWQLYLSQSMRSSWGQMFADDNADEDQDTIKVRVWIFFSKTYSNFILFKMYQENFNRHKSLFARYDCCDHFDS